MQVPKRSAKSEDEKYLSFVCADIVHGTIYVTSLTNELAHSGCKAAIDLINTYRSRYPFFKVIVSDEILCKMLAYQFV